MLEFTAKQQKLLKDENMLELLREAKQEHRLLLMSKPNVVGLGIGLRTRGGRIVDEVCLKVYVASKLPSNLLRKEDLCPSSVTIRKTTIPVDVEEAKVPQAELFTLRSRPLVGGSSAGPVTGGTGTLGCCVTLDDGQTYILTNEHVLGQGGQVAISTQVVQPSIGDGGAAPADVVGTLFSTVPLDFGTTTINIFGITITIPNRNRVDCALARVTNAFNTGNREIHWIGYPAFRTGEVPSSILARILRPVNKMGRTTEYTLGFVIDIAWDGFIDYSNLFGNPLGTNRAWFSDQLRIRGLGMDWSAPGDSGSLVLDATTKEPVGLHFAGSGNDGWANPIENVMDALGIPRI